MVRQSSKQVRINHKINKVKEEPHLSGAYIRNLVKHLTSIKTKPSFNSNKQVSFQQSPPSPPQPPQPPYKKQVRRRHHTTKPYQERLLNMAEARREIATALKFHRASMQQQQEQHEQEQQPQTATNQPQLQLSSTTTNENITFTLPNQTLGLNLNFQDFNNLDTSFCHKPSSSYSISSSSTSSLSSCSSSSSSSSSSAVLSKEAMVNSTINLHHAMDDDEMEKIRSLGEQHQMEWNDTMNLLMSARWFKFLNCTNIDLEQEDEKYDLGFNVFGQGVEFPLCVRL